MDRMADPVKGMLGTCNSRRTASMAGTAAADLLDQVWSYPLFQALYGRRSRRFGLGFAMSEGPYKFDSQQRPVALSDIEEAVLVAAGVGFSGSALWDQSRPLPHRAGQGRTFPSTCHGRRTALFFTNDDGVFVIDPAAPPAAKAQIVGDRSDRVGVLDLYYHHRKRLQPGRLAIPRGVPLLSGHNLWDSNMRGSTLFMPICDVSRSLIGLIAQFVDSQLDHYTPKDSRGFYIVDDRFDCRPAGTKEWVENGFLDPEQVLPLSHLERQACYYMFAEPAIICQNMFLATEAMGIGGWIHCGFTSRGVFEALKFRMVKPNDGPALTNPIGLDGVFQAHCPPYFPTMDAAVDAVLTPLLRNRPADVQAGHPPGSLPYRISDAQHREGEVEISDAGIGCTKSICNYIYETYGRFPGSLDAMHLMWLMQAHHLDLDFYDKFFRPGSYGPTHGAHMRTWHP
jgi:hypothetical protein